MNVQQTAAVLAKIQIADNRSVDKATIAFWHECIGDLEYQDALDAVVSHFRESTEYLKPNHVRSAAQRIRWQREDRLELVGQQVIRSQLGDRAHYVIDWGMKLGEAIRAGDTSEVVEQINRRLESFEVEDRLTPVLGEADRKAMRTTRPLRLELHEGVA